MSAGAFHFPDPLNEPVLTYAPGTAERAALKRALGGVSGAQIEIPLVIGGREVRTGRLGEVRVPHRRAHVVARFHQAGPSEVAAAIAAAREARREWGALDPSDRAAVFLRAAELLAGPWRQRLNAATMVGQSKTPHQAEIDAACETIDFWRFGAHFLGRVLAEQPLSPPGQWNRMEYRPLEGFVLAVTPFNFTSIAANLPTAPALMGNAVVWKPASTAVLAAWEVMRLLEAAGLPPGVVNFVPGPGPVVGEAALASPELAGLHFTGSTATFQALWRSMAERLPGYRSYPRIVGETGGKDFVFVHPSADLEATAVGLVRGAFEYQGQKCSAASRAYVPASLWPRLRERVVALAESLRMGPVEDFSVFLGALIDGAAYERVRGYVDLARASGDSRILTGGRCDGAEGWFVAPTVVETDDPRHRLMQEEIFGPVLSVFVYPDAALEEAVDLCGSTSPYGLTGALFARDRAAIAAITRRLADAAGNFYVNDKPTGAVVGQQPFGGGRASGTNDKAGSMAHLLRWTSMRAIKENFAPPTVVGYPYMEQG